MIHSFLFCTLAIAVLLPTCRSAAQPREIPIGAEIGPNHFLGGWLISWSHPVFVDNNFFFPDMAACGINFNMQSYIPNVGGWNQRQIYDAADNMHILLAARNALLWKSEHLPISDTMFIWHEDFFDAARIGNAGQNIITPNDEGFRFYDTRRTPRNTGGFILGRPGVGNNNPASNCVGIRKYRAFNLGNGVGERYHIWLKMKRVGTLANGNDTLLALHTGRFVKSGNDWVVPDTGKGRGTVYKRCNEIPTDWDWVEFITDSIIVGNQWGFGLQWFGKADSGDVKLRYIAYQGFSNRALFPDPDDPDQPSGAVFDAFVNDYASDASAMGERVLGITAHEPWPYSWHYVNILRQELRDRMGGNLIYTGMEPTLFGTGDATEFLTTTGFDNFILDRYPINAWMQDGEPAWHWEESFDGMDSAGINGKSIQHAWDRWIGSSDKIGLRESAEVARTLGRRLWAGIQSSCELSLRFEDNRLVSSFSDTTQLWSSPTWMAEPTPRMVKCMGFLALTFATRGFFYSYYGPVYGRVQINGTNYGYATQEWYHPSRWESFYGASVSGLVSLFRDVQHENNDTLIENDGDLQFASSWHLGNQWLGDQRGYLGPNPKWYAAKEFNDYVRAVEGTYSQLRFVASECAAEHEDVEYVTNVTASDSVWEVVPFPHWEFDPDPQNETFVQIGIFRRPGRENLNERYFMLVNRRCADGEDRTIECTLTGIQGNTYRVYDVASPMIPLKTGIGSLTFKYWMPPATGRLFLLLRESGLRRDAIEFDTTFAGSVYIDTIVSVASNAVLTILPGSILNFAPGSKLVVNGRLYAKGKPDDEKDSLIVFSAFGEGGDGVLELTGSATDTLSYCKFTHLDKGLKIVKDTGKKTVIDHCEFSYNSSEGLYMSGGEVTVTASSFRENGGDGAYLYNCKATLDSLTVSRNEKNGLYLYSVNSSSTLKHSNFGINGRGADESPDANLRIHNCSPTLERNSIMDGAEFGIYGVNGSYPVMTNSTTAANTIGSNASHETYWNASYPYIDYGHNNFDVVDDTLIYIENLSLGTFYARGNYWGGGEPNTGGTQGSTSYYGPGTFSYLPYDGDFQQRIGNEDPVDLKGGGRQGFGIDDDDDAQDVLRLALEMEVERPVDALDAYRQIIRRWGGSPAAPLAVERMLWLVRNLYEGDVRRGELGRIGNYLQWLADTSRSRALAWKARRAALWALAAQHRYDEAIAGFEAIIDNADCRADSVFAVIDAGTLHLEAQEWAQRDTVDRVRSVFGGRQELSPVSYEAHRKRTDELLAMLGGGEFAGRPTVPTEYFLRQNYSNPFNAVTRISYGLKEDVAVKVKVFDVLGREVITLVDAPQRAGYYTALWSGRNAAGTSVGSGVYFCRIEAGSFVKSMKMTLVK